MTEIKDAEIVPETALTKSNDFDSMLKPQDIPLLRVMETMNSLDWRDLKPHQTAFLLMQKPFPVAGGGTTFLTFRQAILFATRAYELNVSPFSSEIWFNPQTATANLTLEGKKVVARNKGIDLGPPQFEELERPWDQVPKMTDTAKELQKQGFIKDIGVKCRMRVGDKQPFEHVEYICWLSEWAVTRSPVWRDRPTHMLQTRAYEKAISLCLGTGASAMVGDEPDDKE